MKHSCVTFRCVQSAVQVKQQHTCVDNVCLAVWITDFFSVKQPGREAVHYTAFCAKLKETCNCISASHYGFVMSCLIISVTLTQYSFTTEGYKTSVIFAFMPHIIRRGVSFLCAHSFNFDTNNRRGRLLLLLLLLLFKLSSHLSLYRLVGHVLNPKRSSLGSNT